MISALQKALLAMAGLSIPFLACAAAPQSINTAVTDCARSEAAQLGARLVGVTSDAQPLDPAQSRAFLGVQQQEIVVAARDKAGRVVAVMACTVDNDNRVVSLRPATPD